MNQSYVNQQNQLMSMNVVREAQRLQLSQAETIVKLNQLKEEVIKALPPKNVRVVTPTSNAALESTLEGKRPPPVSTNGSPRTIPDLDAQDTQVLASKGSPSAAKANSRASSIYGSSPTSPSASEAPTVSTSTTAQGDVGSPTALLAHVKGQMKALADIDEDFKQSAIYISLSRSNPTKVESQRETIDRIKRAMDVRGKPVGGDGLGRGKNGRGKKPVGGDDLGRGKNGRFTKR
jgi:hypothetical protein